MKKYFVGLTALLAMTAMVALGADVDGKWTREAPGRGGGAPTVTTLTLKADGKKLTGKMEGGRGGGDISEGMIDGANVSFKIVTEGQKGKQETTYAGTVSATELKLTPTRAGGGGGGGKGGGEQVYTKAK